MAQRKEQIKTPEKELNNMEVSHLSDAEFTFNPTLTQVMCSAIILTGFYILLLILIGCFLLPYVPNH